MKTILAAGMAVALLAGAGPASAARLQVGKPAPDFTVTTFGGRTLRLADFQGVVVVLNFWATWCAPCRAELPLLEAEFRANNQAGLQVLAVATEDSVPETYLKPLAAKLTIPFVHRLQGPYKVMGGVPTNYIIDRAGVLRYAKAASFTPEELNKVLLPLLQEPAPEPPKPAAAPSP